MAENTTTAPSLTSGETSTPGAGTTSGATSTPAAPPTLDAAKPAADKKAEKKTEKKSTEPEELQATAFKMGEAVVLDFGVSAKEQVPATISGVFSDHDGISYAVSVHLKDAVLTTGKAAQTVSLEVPASLLKKPKAAKEQKAE